MEELIPEDIKTCFVICPIGSDGTDIRKRADQILKHVLKPAADSTRYERMKYLNLGLSQAK